MVGAPLVIDIRAGAVAALAPLLADRRISSGGHVAIAVGPGQGEEIAATVRPALENCSIFGVAVGSLESATDLAGRLRGASTTRWSASAAGARSTWPSTRPA
jgi:hypothetical protein